MNVIDCIKLSKLLLFTITSFQKGFLFLSNLFATWISWWGIINYFITIIWKNELFQLHGWYERFKNILFWINGNVRNFFPHKIIGVCDKYISVYSMIINCTGPVKFTGFILKFPLAFFQRSDSNVHWNANISTSLFCI